MSPQKKPPSHLAHVNVSHGLKNSLDNSFVDGSLTKLSSFGDLSFDWTLCVTSPKELSFEAELRDNELDDFLDKCLKNCKEAPDCGRCVYPGKNMPVNMKEKVVPAKEKDLRNQHIKNTKDGKEENRKCSVKQDYINNENNKRNSLQMNKERQQCMSCNYKESKIMNQKIKEKTEADKRKMEKRNAGDQTNVDEETSQKEYMDCGKRVEKEKGSLEVDCMEKEKIEVEQNAPTEMDEVDSNIDGSGEQDTETKVCDRRKEKWEIENQEKKTKTERKLKGENEQLLEHLECCLEITEKESREFKRENEQSENLNIHENNSCPVRSMFDQQDHHRSKVEAKECLVGIAPAQKTNLTGNVEAKECLVGIAPAQKTNLTGNVEAKECQVGILPAEKTNCTKNHYPQDEICTNYNAEDSILIETVVRETAVKSTESDESKSALYIGAGGSSGILNDFVFASGSFILRRNSACISWICVSFYPAEEDSGSGISLSHGSSRSRSDSPRGSGSSDGGGRGGGLRDSAQGASSGDSGQGSGFGGCFGSSGNGGGRDDDDQNWEQGRNPNETVNRGRKRKADKKLKDKCRLEHGILTKEDISMIIGWLQQQGCSVPENMKEMLKCFVICLEDRRDSYTCTACSALILMLKHLTGCDHAQCKCCFGVVTLYQMRVTHTGIDGRWNRNGFLNGATNEDYRELLKHMLEASTSSDEETLSGSDTDNDSEPNLVNVTGSIPVVNGLPTPQVFVPTANDPPMRTQVAAVQGPPNEFVDDPEYASEIPPTSSIYFPSQNQRRLYSMPVDTRNVRRGSVIYGNKDLLRNMVTRLHEWADRLRSPVPQEQDFNHTIASNRNGVILSNRTHLLTIQQNNYEPDEELVIVTDKPLGSGVSGSCFAGCDWHTGFSFCVKKIPLHKFFADEVLIWLDMEHPDIVELYGVVAYDRWVYIIQELILGPTLKEHITRDGKKALSSYEALSNLHHCLTLLEYLKNKGIIHNDIKADNLLVREPDKSTRLVLIDFGLAVRASSVPSGVSPVGGQTHWSPEKAASEGYSFPADLWAAIAVFVHMLSGIEPWCVRFKHARFLHHIIKQHSPPLEDIPTDLPRQIHQLIVDGWMVDPQNRPSASDLLIHEAFRLLDSDPSAELFVSHLSRLESPEVEFPNVEAILDESETEQLISQAQQHLSLGQSSHLLPSVELQDVAGARLPSYSHSFSASSLGNASNWSMGNRPLFSMHERYLPPVMEEPSFTFDMTYETNSAEQGVDMKPRMRGDDDEDIEGLTDLYDDLSIHGQKLVIESRGSRGSTESHSMPRLTWSQTEMQPGNSSRLMSVTGVTTMPPSIPLMIEEWELSSDEEKSTADPDNALQLHSNDGDEVDHGHNFRPAIDSSRNVPVSYSLPPSSLGRTLRMMLRGEQIYCIHLHPGTECVWTEVVLRASMEIHNHDVAAFTAEVYVGGRREPIDISDAVPSDPEIQLEILPVDAIHDQEWTWKIEDSHLIYHPNYQGHFGPQFD